MSTMGHVAPPPLAELTARAQTLSSAGDLAGARRVLDNALDPAAATDPRRADADLALAAALHARILIALGDAHGARLWAGYAHAAEDRLHGPQHHRTIAAAATHAAVLQRVGHFGRAAQVYRQLVGDLTELEGADSPRVLAAEADLATAEHAAGHCTAARSRLLAAWQRHSRRYGDASPAGIKMLARLGAMERECGRDDQAREHLAQAQELCARYLPFDHPLVRQVAALVEGSASGRHVCGRVEQSDGPGVTTVGAPGVRTVPFPRRPTVPDPEEFPPDDPGQPPPDNRPTDPNGTVYQQPLYLADVHQEPGDLQGRHARADTPPPMPGRRAPDYGPDGRPQPVGSAPASTYTLPPNTERLPVRTEAAPPPRRRQPFVLAAVLVAGVAAAVAVVALTLPDADGAEGPAATATTPPAASSAAPPPPSAAATSRPPTADPGAPTGVKLRDNRDNVLLQWTYPRNSEGPILVSGGRAGQPQKPFQQLPAGSSDYVVYGLNETTNYCFTIAVAYGTNNIDRSAPVCTKR
ncbi:fibronectin type III domain-containing protein [Paractinoplanes abujensis]|uniref:Tetratricopeptide (TPR) repeat protein n=1 Tax=Paractinoplanes abujensis TaxID=882441 RepID=A0A7W7D082_9ACTN|nr:fibronectin type III domain-containing protein [Actinoplanes abujensis]MBB4697935.1 tetratricopeptide (TPR) repeat protein [Actinoplanes abujensis]